MSEDKTKIVGKEEPTEELEGQKAVTTQPTLKEILEEMRAFRTETNQRFDTIEQRLSAIETEVDVFRHENKMRFDAIEQKINILNERILDLDARQRTQEKRLSDLERKAS